MATTTLLEMMLKLGEIWSRALLKIVVSLDFGAKWQAYAWA